MYKKMNNNYKKVLEIFFDNPTGRFHIREIARLTKLNPNTIINIVKKLEKEDLVRVEKKTYLVEISAHFENKKFKEKKRISNILKLYESGLIDFLVKEYSPKAVSVIGSYSLGEDIEESDIDIVIITNKEEEIDIKKFEEKIGRKIHLLPVSYNKISDEFYTNLINGVVLYGYIRKK